MIPTPTAAPPLMACVADCEQDGRVSVGDIVLAVRVSLDLAALSECTEADADLDGVVTIAELIYAVNSALGDCR